MNNEIMNKVNDIIKHLDNNDTIKKYKSLKSMLSDQEIKKLMNKFNVLREQYYENKVITNEFKQAKEALYNHPIVKEYRLIETNIDYFVKYFNHALEMLTNNKECQNSTYRGI